MKKLALSLLHFLIVTVVSLAILLAVVYATVLNEAFWLKNIAQHALVPSPTTTNSPSVATETNVLAVVLKALPEEALRAEATGLTKATFEWLRGDSDKLDYRPNLEAFKPQIVASLEKQYLEKFQANPIVCPPTGVISDPEMGLTIPCGSIQDPATLAKLYADSVATSAVQDAAVQNSTKAQETSLPVSLPGLYQAGQITTWVLPFVSSLLIIITTALAPQKLRQLSYIGRHVCLALVPNILIIGGGLLLMSISLQISPQAIADLQQYGLGGLLRAVVRESAIFYLIITAGVMVLALIVWLAARQLAQRSRQAPSPPQTPHGTL